MATRPAPIDPRGPRFGPFLRLYADILRPRLGAPAELEDPRPPRCEVYLFLARRRGVRLVA